MTSPDKVVIVGAGQAGLQTAEALRAMGYAGSITLLGAERCGPYHRPPLSKAWLAGEMAAEQIAMRSPDALERKGIALRTDAQAMEIDIGKRLVRLADGVALSYDTLVVATGASPRTLDIPGRDAQGVLVLRSMDDAQAIAQRMVLFQVEISGAKGFVARFELLAQRDVAVGGVLCAERIKVAPQRAADKAHALPDAAFAFQPKDAQSCAGRLHALPGLVKFQPVVFVVAGHKHHGRRPVSAAFGFGQGRKPRQPKVGDVQAGEQRAGLIRGDVARQNEQISAGQRRGLKVGVGLKVQVGEELDVHPVIVREVARRRGPEPTPAPGKALWLVKTRENP